MPSSETTEPIAASRHPGAGAVELFGCGPHVVEYELPQYRRSTSPAAMSSATSARTPALDPSVMPTVSARRSLPGRATGPCSGARLKGGIWLVVGRRFRDGDSDDLCCGRHPRCAERGRPGARPLGARRCRIQRPLKRTRRLSVRSRGVLFGRRHLGLISPGAAWAGLGVRGRDLTRRLPGSGRSCLACAAARVRRRRPARPRARTSQLSEGPPHPRR